MSLSIHKWSALHSHIVHPPLSDHSYDTFHFNKNILLFLLCLLLAIFIFFFNVINLFTEHTPHAQVLTVTPSLSGEGGIPLGHRHHHNFRCSGCPRHCCWYLTLRVARHDLDHSGCPWTHGERFVWLSIVTGSGLWGHDDEFLLPRSAGSFGLTTLDDGGSAWGTYAPLGLFWSPWHISNGWRLLNDKLGPRLKIINII